MLLYIAAFSAAENALSDITISRAAHPDATVDMSTVTRNDAETNTTASSIFWHYAPSGETTGTAFGVFGQDPDATLNLGHYARQSWGRSLQAAIRSEMTDVGTWSPSNFSISFSNTTGLYTIAYSDPITITWASAAGRQVCGFAADVSVAASSSVGTVIPTYVYAPTVQAVSDNTPNYEPEGIATHGITDSGRGFGKARSVSPLYRDWRQEFETKERTIRANAAATFPWTLEHLFTHCRGQYAFIVVSGFGESFDEAFSFRSEGTVHKPQRHSPGNDAQFFAEFATVVEGTVSALGEA